MTKSAETLCVPVEPDPHFNRLVALAGLSQAALQGVIHVLQAQEQPSADTTEAHGDPEKLLAYYIQGVDL